MKTKLEINFKDGSQQIIEVDKFETLTDRDKILALNYFFRSWDSYQILNGEIRERCEEFCPNCHKRIRMQGNGILEPLCECSTQQNSLERT